MLRAARHKEAAQMGSVKLTSTPVLLPQTHGEVVGVKRVNRGEGSAGGFANGLASQRGLADGVREIDITAPATSEAQRWDGWGTALKPAIEPIILARKPLDGTVAGNVLAHGVGGLNIDACRVGTTVETWPKSRMYGGNPSEVAFTKTSGDAVSAQPTGEAPAGRFPANVLLDEHAAKEMDEQSGWSPSNARKRKKPKGKKGDPSEFLGDLKGTGAGFE